MLIDLDDLYPYQREAMKRLVSNEQVIFVGADTDYATIERRVLAAMAMDGEVFIDFESPGGYIDGSSFAKQRLCDIVKEPEPPGPPMKQNGRSAAYLKHDRTKQHKRRRR